jgi:hypothetical protein
MNKGFSFSNELNFVTIINKIKESKTNLIVAFVIAAIILIPTIIASNGTGLLFCDRLKLEF